MFMCMYMYCRIRVHLDSTRASIACRSSGGLRTGTRSKGLLPEIDGWIDWRMDRDRAEPVTFTSYSGGGTEATCCELESIAV